MQTTNMNTRNRVYDFTLTEICIRCCGYMVYGYVEFSRYGRIEHTEDGKLSVARSEKQKMPR